MNQIQEAPRDEAARRVIRGARSIEFPISHDQEICLDQTILVRASAGSGKTSVLIDRMVALVRSGVPLGSIVAITFTRKASGELQERFFGGLIKARESIHELIRSGSEGAGSLWKSEFALLNKAVEEIEDSYIGTIHAFCAQLLRYGALDLGIPPEFEQINEQDEEALRLQFWNSYLQEASASEHADLEVLHDADVPFEWLFDLFGTLSKNEAVDFELSHRPCPDPSAAFEYLKDFVARIAPLVPQMNDPDDFSTEMERMKALISTLDTSNKYVQIRLLKSALGLKSGGQKPELKIVPGRWGSGKSEPKILAEDIKKGREDLGLTYTFDHFFEEYLTPLIKEWNYWLHDRALAFTRSAVDAYIAHRLASGKLTYDDLLSQSLGLLRQFPALRATFQRRFTHILVDEFQDTDPTQAAMLFCLASKEWNDPDWSKSVLLPGRLFLVGDDKQSIYRFRKADFQAFHLVRNAIVEQGGLDLKLSTNFRSDSRLCSWINATLGPRFHHSRVPFQAPWEDLEPFWGDLGLDPIVHFQVAKKSKGVVLAHQTMGEAEAIVTHILRLKSELEHNLDFGNFMILVRRHANIPEYVAALTAAGIPVGVAGGKADQITDLLTLLDDLFSAVYNPFNGPALAATLRGPFYGVSDQDLYDFVQQGGALHELLGDVKPEASSSHLAKASNQLRSIRTFFTELPPYQALEQILALSGIEGLLRSQENAEMVSGMLHRVLELFKSWETKGYSFGQCSEEFSLYRNGELKLESFSESLPFGNCVRIMTIHQAKGLQAAVVFLADVGGSGLKRAKIHTFRDGSRVVGKVPVFRPTGFDKIEEIEPFGWETAVELERQFDEAENERLIYVACTRAEKQLVVCTNEEPNTGTWDALAPYLSGYVSDSVPIEIQPILVHPVLHASEWKFSGVTQPPQTSLPEPKWSKAELQNQISVLSQPSWVFERPSDSDHERTLPTQAEQDLFSATQSDRSRSLGLEYGSAMHAIFESLVAKRKLDWDDNDVSGWAVKILEDRFRDSKVSNLIQLGSDAAVSFFRSALWPEIRMASRVLTEVPFTISDHTGGEMKIVSGVVDLAYLVGATWVIVDYKTDQLDESGLTERHSHQLSSYLNAWAQIFEGTRIDAYLWSTHLGKSIHVGTRNEKGED